MPADTYNKLFTAHGIIMVWFFLVPVVPTVLGNFLVPMMIGARDLAFPKLNLLSWYIFTLGAIITLWAILAGGVDTGWTFYTPFSIAIRPHQRHPDDHRHFHLRLLVDPHGAELHRHHAPHARARHDLVPHAAVFVGASTPPASSWSWPRRCWPWR